MFSYDELFWVCFRLQEASWLGGGVLWRANIHCFYMHGVEWQGTLQCKSEMEAEMNGVAVESMHDSFSPVHAKLDRRAAMQGV